MFFLRCAFWLSIVYASMSWPNAEFGPAASKASSSPISISTLARSAADGASAYCAKHAQDCLAGAARLTALVDAANRGDAASLVTASPPPRIAAEASVPLPVPDPRRGNNTSHGRF